MLMALEQALLSWVHITSAAIWVGGSLFIGAVFAPILIAKITKKNNHIRRDNCRLICYNLVFSSTTELWWRNLIIFLNKFYYKLS